ncbi:MAG TPA: methyltransferase domain-containing protein, partial [Candidatus Limnocylindrales bacterium]
MTNDWDAATYDRIADPQARWGSAVLDRLPLRGDERVLDAGCGSGRVTAQLLERLPDGEVVALDASPAMVEEARRRLGDDARLTFVVADLLEPLPVVPPVDAILSTATFHWVTDHDRLFRNL